MASPFSVVPNNRETLFAELRPLWKELQDHPPPQRGRPFPAEEFGLLQRYGVLALPLPVRSGGLGLGSQPGTWSALLKLLRCLGYISLPVARLYEGHVNAIRLIERFGTESQQAQCAQWVWDEGFLSAVWNTDRRRSPVMMEALGGGNFVLDGSKDFASGAGWVMQPVLTAEWAGRGRQMVWLNQPDLIERLDPHSWEATGMRESASFSVDFTGLRFDCTALLGKPGDYYREPDFSAGAIRFVAAHLGGAERLAKEAVEMALGQGCRENTPRLARMGEVAVLMESGRQWVETTALLLDQGRVDESTLLTHVQMARTAVERICLHAMELVERSIGARGLLEPHVFGRILADLRMYLRQPFADQTLLDIGLSFCEGGYPNPEPF